MSQDKTVQTAVVVSPPSEAWGPIQQIREKHDRAYRRWLPHVNLLYPFHPVTRFEEFAQKFRAELEHIAPFEIRLNQFNHFKHGKKSYTLWLAPEPNDQLIQLQAALERCAPMCDDLRTRGAEGFAPHLSVGQAKSAAQLEAMKQEFSEGWTPIVWPVTHVTLIFRHDPPDDIFQEAIRVPLGPNQTVQRLPAFLALPAPGEGAQQEGEGAAATTKTTTTEGEPSEGVSDAPAPVHPTLHFCPLFGLPNHHLGQLTLPAEHTTQRPQSTHVLALLDKSGSMGQSFANVAVPMVETLVNALEPRWASTVTFGRTITDQIIPVDANARRQYFTRLKATQLEGQTNIRDAVTKGVEVIHNVERMRSAGDGETMHLVILLTDGRENAYRDRDETLRRIERDATQLKTMSPNVVVVVVGITGSHDVRLCLHVRQHWTTVVFSGRDYHYAPSFKEVPQVAQAIVEELSDLRASVVANLSVEMQRDTDSEEAPCFGFRPSALTTAPQSTCRLVSTTYESCLETTKASPTQKQGMYFVFQGDPTAEGVTFTVNGERILKECVCGESAGESGLQLPDRPRARDAQRLARHLVAETLPTTTTTTTTDDPEPSDPAQLEQRRAQLLARINAVVAVVQLWYRQLRGAVVSGLDRPSILRVAKFLRRLTQSVYHALQEYNQVAKHMRAAGQPVERLPWSHLMRILTPLLEQLGTLHTASLSTDHERAAFLTDPSSLKFASRLADRTEGNATPIQILASLAKFLQEENIQVPLEQQGKESPISVLSSCSTQEHLEAIVEDLPELQAQAAGEGGQGEGELDMLEIVYGLGVVGLEIRLSRSDACAIDPWKLNVEYVSPSTFGDTQYGSLAWRLERPVLDYARAPITDFLPLIDPRDPLPGRVFWDTHLCQPLLSLAFSRTLHGYLFKQRPALVVLSLVKAVQQLAREEASQTQAHITNLFHMLYTLHHILASAPHLREQYATLLHQFISQPPKEHRRLITEDVCPSLCEFLGAACVLPEGGQLACNSVALGTLRMECYARNAKTVLGQYCMGTLVEVGSVREVKTQTQTTEDHAGDGDVGIDGLPLKEHATPADTHEDTTEPAPAPALLMPRPDEPLTHKQGYLARAFGIDLPLLAHHTQEHYSAWLEAHSEDFLTCENPFPMPERVPEDYDFDTLSLDAILTHFDQNSLGIPSVTQCDLMTKFIGLLANLPETGESHYVDYMISHQGEIPVCWVTHLLNGMTSHCGGPTEEVSTARACLVQGLLYCASSDRNEAMDRDDQREAMQQRLVRMKERVGRLESLEAREGVEGEMDSEGTEDDIATMHLGALRAAIETTEQKLCELLPTSDTVMNAEHAEQYVRQQAANLRTSVRQALRVGFVQNAAQERARLEKQRREREFMERQAEFLRTHSGLPVLAGPGEYTHLAKTRTGLFTTACGYRECPLFAVDLGSREALWAHLRLMGTGFDLKDPRRHFVCGFHEHSINYLREHPGASKKSFVRAMRSRLAFPEHHQPETMRYLNELYDSLQQRSQDPQ